MSSSNIHPIFQNLLATVDPSKRSSSEFPDITPTLKEMKLRDKLMEIPPIGSFAVSIRWALENRKDMKDICQMIMDQYKVDPVDVRFILGDEIITLCKEHGL